MTHNYYVLCFLHVVLVSTLYSSRDFLMFFLYFIFFLWILFLSVLYSLLVLLFFYDDVRGYEYDMSTSWLRHDGLMNDI